MKELITITKHTINNKEINCVDARDLHAYLESKQEFANWIKNRIKKYGFVEKEDYEVFDKFIKNSDSVGGRPTKEYAITLDMAKELSMVENNEKGRAARKYFIECERLVKEVVQIKIGSTRKQGISKYDLQNELIVAYRDASKAYRNAAEAKEELLEIHRAENKELKECVDLINRIRALDKRMAELKKKMDGADDREQSRILAEFEELHAIREKLSFELSKKKQFFNIYL